ncbi:fha domain protein [Nannochloropsis oceanica]
MGLASSTMGAASSSKQDNSSSDLTQQDGHIWGRTSLRVSGGDDGATCVQVKIMPLVPGKANREVKTFKISSNGAVLEGGMTPEIRDIAREYEKMTGEALPRISIDDRRAQQLLVSCVGEDYYVAPAPELFSRHTGTCRVLGDKHQRTTDYRLQVGDFLRIGSVGLIVSELHPGKELGRAAGGDSSDSGSSSGNCRTNNGTRMMQESSMGTSHAASNRRGNASGSSGDTTQEGDLGATNGGRRPRNPYPNNHSNTSTTNYHSVPLAITEKDLFYLREDVGELRNDLFAQQEAATAAEEGLAAAAGGLTPGRSPRVIQCYMCFDDEDTVENPLVAPCLCKGGTRYVHLTCLQKWQASAGDDKDCVVATSAELKNTCKICKSKYKTHVRAKDGRLLPLLGHQLPPPFICFLVVTKHDTAEELFNTQFQLSFAENKQILIGRSRTCQMVLDYRTVSTQHATVTFRKGGFYFRDLSSSNGSMLNLRRPMKLPYNQWQENGTATASEGGGRGGERGNASAALSDMDPKALQRAQLQLLESLCRIDNTPRLCGDAGNLIDSPVMGGRGGGRMSLLATGEEALGTALFQMHLQGASSRRVFDLTGRRESEEDEDDEDEEGEDGEEEEEEKEEREEEEGKTRTSMAIGRNNGGVRFVPAYSPMANSQMSQLSA